MCVCVLVCVLMEGCREVVSWHSMGWLAQTRARRHDIKAGSRVVLRAFKKSLCSVCVGCWLLAEI